MVSASETIRNLKNKLTKFRDEIIRLGEVIESLKSTNLVDIYLKDQQLRALEQKISNLLSKNEENLNAVCQEILIIWTNYERSRDKIIELLKVQERKKQETIDRLTSRNRYWFGTISFLLISFLLYWWWKKKAKKTPQKKIY